MVRIRVRCLVTELNTTGFFHSNKVCTLFKFLLFIVTRSLRDLLINSYNKNKATVISTLLSEINLSFIVKGFPIELLLKT